MNWYINQLVHLILQNYLSIMRRHRIKSICSIEPALGHSLEQVANNSFNSKELKWIEQIEDYRRLALNTTTSIEVEYLGAGHFPFRSRYQKKSTYNTHQRTIAKIARYSSTQKFGGSFLFSLIRHYQPTVGIELGTSIGISASYHGAALALNGFGKLITIEGANNIAEYARNQLSRLGLSSVMVVTGRFEDVLKDILKKYGPIDYLFIDGDHHFQATINYFNICLPSFRPHGIVVVDDIYWSKGMRNAWRTLCHYPQVKIGITLFTMGILVLQDLQGLRKLYRL